MKDRKSHMFNYWYLDNWPFIFYLKIAGFGQVHGQNACKKKKISHFEGFYSFSFAPLKEKKKEEYVSFSLVTHIFSTSQPSFIFNDWWYGDGFCHYTAWPPSGPELKKANISYITLENTSVFCCPLNYHQHTAGEKMKKCPRLSATELGCLLQKPHFWRKTFRTISFVMKPSVHCSLNDHLIIFNVIIYYLSPCKQKCFLSWNYLWIFFTPRFYLAILSIPLTTVKILNNLSSHLWGYF